MDPNLGIWFLALDQLPDPGGSRFSDFGGAPAHPVDAWKKIPRCQWPHDFSCVYLQSDDFPTCWEENGSSIPTMLAVVQTLLFCCHGLYGRRSLLPSWVGRNLWWRSPNGAAARQGCGLSIRGAKKGALKMCDLWPTLLLYAISMCDGWQAYLEYTHVRHTHIHDTL